MRRRAEARGARASCGVRARGWTTRRTSRMRRSVGVGVAANRSQSHSLTVTTTTTTPASRLPTLRPRAARSPGSARASRDVLGGRDGARRGPRRGDLLLSERVVPGRRNRAVIVAWALVARRLDAAWDVCVIRVARSPRRSRATTCARALRDARRRAASTTREEASSTRLRRIAATSLVARRVARRTRGERRAWAAGAGPRSASPRPSTASASAPRGARVGLRAESRRATEARASRARGGGRDERRRGRFRRRRERSSRRETVALDLSPGTARARLVRAHERGAGRGGRGDRAAIRRSRAEAEASVGGRSGERSAREVLRGGGSPSAKVLSTVV